MVDERKRLTVDVKLQELETTLENLEPKIKFLLTNGEAVVAKTPESATERLKQNLQVLQQRWDNVKTGIRERQAKLTDAVDQANNFQDSLTDFNGWLTNTDKMINNLKPVSRVVATVTEQIAEHQVNTHVRSKAVCYSNKFWQIDLSPASWVEVHPPQRK